MPVETLSQKFGSKEKMKPRERVQAAFAKTIPDRVPINYMANPAIDGRLKEHFGLKKEDHEGLGQALGVDMRSINPPYVGPRLHPEIPGKQVNPIWGIVTEWVEHGAGGYFDYVDFPLRYADEETVANWPMPSPDDFDYQWVKRTARELEDYALYVGSPGMVDCINWTGMLRSMEQVFMDMILDEPAWNLLIDRKVAVQAEMLARTLEAAEGRVTFVWTGDDLGTQDSPLISMDVFKQQLRPRHEKVIKVAKDYDNLPILTHSCGSSSWAFEEFIDMGVNAMDTLQPEAKNMQPAYLKEKFGDKLAFHGCISTAGPVSFGAVADVEKDCRKVLDIMMPGGGYMYAPTHSLQDNSPTENVLAMYEMAHQHGYY